MQAGLRSLASVHVLANQPHGIDIVLAIRRLHDLLRLMRIGAGAIVDSGSVVAYVKRRNSCSSSGCSIVMVSDPPTWSAVGRMS